MDWFRFAKADLAVASMPLPEGGLYEQLCFHAQQAAEKSLKALLVQMGIPFPKTHNIAHLIDLLPAFVQRSPELLASAGLTVYATIFRYPGEAEPLDAAARDEAVRLAKWVYSWALDLVKERGPAAG